MKRLLHYSLQLNNIAYSLLLLVAAIGLYQLIAFYPLHWDATQNASNSLTPASVDTLKQLHGTLNITMYANSKDAELGDIEQIGARFYRPVSALQGRHQADLRRPLNRCRGHAQSRDSRQPRDGGGIWRAQRTPYPAE